MYFPDTSNAHKTLHLSDFKSKPIRPKLCAANVLVIVSVAAMVLAFVSIFKLPPTGAFLGLSMGFVGLSCVSYISSLVIRYVKEKISEQNFSRYLNNLSQILLYQSQNFDEYKARLSYDRGIRHSYKIPNFVDIHLAENERFSANLLRVSQIDNERLHIYQFNGKKLHTKEEIESNYKVLVDNIDIYLFANHSPVADIFTVLLSRYNNMSIGVLIKQNEFRGTPNTKFNLIVKDNNYFLTITQLCHITIISSTPIVFGYLKAKIHIDFQTKEAVITWKSPSHEIPTL